MKKIIIQKIFNIIKNSYSQYIIPTLTIICLIFQSFIIFQQTKISKKQLEISNTQSEFERKKEEAAFNLFISEEQSGNSGTNHDLENMYIQSNGKFSRIDSVTFYTYLDIDYYNTDTNYYNTLSFQLDNYYSAKVWNPGDKFNPIRILGSYGNHEKYVNFKHSFEDNKKINCNIRRYVEIKYTDLFNDEKVIYFIVEPIYGARMLEDTEATKSLFHSKPDSVSLFDLTPEYIEERLKD